MSNDEIRECNQKCRKKYIIWKDIDLRNKLMELDPHENPFHIEGIPKEGLLAKICAIECGLIEQGWRS